MPSGYLTFDSGVFHILKKEKNVSYKAVYAGGKIVGVRYAIGGADMPHLSLNKIKQGILDTLTNETIIIISGVDAPDCMDLSVFNIKGRSHDYNIFGYNPNNHQRNLQPFSAIPWMALRAWYAYKLAKQQGSENCADVEMQATKYTYITKTLLSGDMTTIWYLMRDDMVLNTQSTHNNIHCQLTVMGLKEGEIYVLKTFDFYLPYHVYASWDFYFHDYSLILRDMNQEEIKTNYK